MIKKIKGISLPTWIAAILIGLIISLSAFIYKGTCKDIDELKKNKADRSAVIQMLEVMKVRQDYIEKDQKERKKRDEKTIETLQNLDKQIFILNENLKKQ